MFKRLTCRGFLLDPLLLIVLSEDPEEVFGLRWSIPVLFGVPACLFQVFKGLFLTDPELPVLAFKGLFLAKPLAADLCILVVRGGKAGGCSSSAATPNFSTGSASWFDEPPSSSIRLSEASFTSLFAIIQNIFYRLIKGQHYLKKIYIRKWWLLWRDVFPYPIFHHSFEGIWAFGFPHLRW